MTITDEMVERAASAIYDFDHKWMDPPPIPLLALPHHDLIATYKDRARAALEAALKGEP